MLELTDWGMPRKVNRKYRKLFYFGYGEKYEMNQHITFCVYGKMMMPRYEQKYRKKKFAILQV